jgi:hypothetical protein
LVRRNGSFRAAWASYTERIIPSTLLILLGPGLAVRFVSHTFPWEVWHLILLMFVFLVLAVTGAVRNWHWLLRLALQAGWILALSTAVFRVVSQQGLR